MSVRINARVDDALARQLDELRRLTGKTLTELIEAALTAYCGQMKRATPSAYEIFKRSGFIGIAKKGPKDLSRNYKRYLTKSLGRKT